MHGSVHVLAGTVQLLFKSGLLTGLFHDTAKGTLHFGQQPCTHLLKLASGGHSHRLLIDNTHFGGGGDIKADEHWINSACTNL